VAWCTKRYWPRHCYCLVSWSTSLAMRPRAVLVFVCQPVPEPPKPLNPPPTGPWRVTVTSKACPSVTALAEVVTERCVACHCGSPGCGIDNVMIATAHTVTKGGSLQVGRGHYHLRPASARRRRRKQVRGSQTGTHRRRGCRQWSLWFHQRRFRPTIVTPQPPQHRPSLGTMPAIVGAFAGPGK